MSPPVLNNALGITGGVLPQMGLRKVLITCLDTNEASRRTILHAGGVYESTEHEPNENENLERYWITLKGE